MHRQKWFDHKFNFGIDIGWTQNIMTRIKDCEVRLIHHCKSLDDDKLSIRLENKWSIKEHIGHLIDLEQLWKSRFLQLEKLYPELIPADLLNKKTDEANHNIRSFNELILEFHSEREILIEIFNGLNDDALNHSALHGRTGMQMKPVDLLYFIAEHDNHHITSINNIKNHLT